MSRVVGTSENITEATVAVFGGVVRVIGASIGSDFIVEAWFEGNDQNGLTAQIMKVNGRFQWNAQCNDQTALDLRDAQVGSLILGNSVKPPKQGNVVLQGLTYRDFESARRVTDGSQTDRTRTT